MPLKAVSEDDGLPEDGGIPEQSAEITRGPEQTAEPDQTTASVPQPAMGRSVARSGRVKTRLLGFGAEDADQSDPFNPKPQTQNVETRSFPVGWLVVVKGPGRGAAYTLFDGVTSIGRGENQTVCLNFGDNSISRENHAATAYDMEQGTFFIGHGGKANLVRLNDRPVLSTEEISFGDLVRIGETTLRFVPLCGPDFSWDETPGGQAENVAYR